MSWLPSLKVKHHSTRLQYNGWPSAFPSTRHSSVNLPWNSLLLQTSIFILFFSFLSSTSWLRPDTPTEMQSTCWLFHLHQTFYCAEWKHCRDLRVIVRWAHAFLFWSCLPTAMCSTHLHLFIFTSLHIQRYSDIPSHLSHSNASRYTSRPTHANKPFIASFKGASSSWSEALQPYGCTPLWAAG